MKVSLNRMNLCVFFLYACDIHRLHFIRTNLILFDITYNFIFTLLIKPHLVYLLKAYNLCSLLLIYMLNQAICMKKVLAVQNFFSSKTFFGKLHTLNSREYFLIILHYSTYILVTF